MVRGVLPRMMGLLQIVCGVRDELLDVNPYSSIGMLMSPLAADKLRGVLAEWLKDTDPIPDSAPHLIEVYGMKVYEAEVKPEEFIYFYSDARMMGYLNVETLELVKIWGGASLVINQPQILH